MNANTNDDRTDGGSRNDRISRQLLLGLLALQNDFVTREQLVGAVSVWLLQPTSRSLSDLLAEQGALKAEERALIEALAARFLERHGDDVERSLAALSSVGPVRDDLQALDNSELDFSLSLVSVAVQPPNMAETLQVGSPTSEGLRFRILRPYAQGGLGRVSVAMDEELNREVALKEIHDQFGDDPDSRQRFVLEAEITGGLEHPGIVPVYGLGQYDNGRPFYAMRFVRGDNLKNAIDRYHGQSNGDKRGEERSLELRKLLRRFIDVCQALHYAHSRGVLHRDLKPGNIMLGKYGETLVVDWGLAKTVEGDETASQRTEPPLQPRSGDSSTQTRMGSVIGTPAFMSPEQADGRLESLGVASDIYGLGATLYALLTGKPPVEGKGVEEVLQKVRTGDIPSPRIRQPGVPAPLSAICDKAMEVEPANRYVSAEDLADDIERWMADEPVSAFPEPWTMRAARWVRRHRTWAVAGAVCLLLVTIVTSAASVVIYGQKTEIAALARRESRARRDADQRREEAVAARGLAVEAQEKEAEARLVAEEKREQAEAITEYLVDAFESTNPEQDGRTVTVAEILDRSVERLASRDDVEPGLRIALLHALGRAYDGLGLPEESIRLLERCRELRTTYPEMADSVPETRFLTSLGSAYRAAARGDDAIEQLERAHELFVEEYGEQHVHSLTALSRVGLAYRFSDRITESLAIFEAAYNGLLGLPDVPPEILLVEQNLAEAYQANGEYEKAREQVASLLDRLEQMPDEPHQASLTYVLNTQAAVAWQSGRPDEAIELFDRNLAICEEVFGPDHPNTLVVLGNLALAHYTSGDVEQAIPLLEETLERTRERLGDEHDDTILSRVNLGAALRTLPDLERSIDVLQIALRDAREHLGPTHSTTMTAMNNLAIAYQDAAQLDDALELYRETLQLRLERFGEGHPSVVTSQHNLATCHLLRDEFEEAAAIFEVAVEAAREAFGTEHPNTLTSMHAYAIVLRELGRVDEARDMMEQTWQSRSATHGSTNRDTLLSLYNLSRMYLETGQTDEAVRLVDVPEILELEHWSAHAVRGALGAARIEQDRLDEAETLLLTAYAGLEEQAAALSWHERYVIVDLIDDLVALYVATDQSAEAEAWRQKKATWEMKEEDSADSTLDGEPADDDGGTNRGDTESSGQVSSGQVSSGTEDDEAAGAEGDGVGSQPR